MALLDALLAALLVSVLAAALLGLQQASTRQSHRMRIEVLVRQTLSSILDRQASGEARGLLLGPATEDWTYTRVLFQSEWAEGLSEDEVALLSPCAPEFRVTLALAGPPAPGDRITLGDVTVAVRFTPSGHPPRTLSVATITDAL